MSDEFDLTFIKADLCLALPARDDVLCCSYTAPGYSIMLSAFFFKSGLTSISKLS